MGSPKPIELLLPGGLGGMGHGISRLIVVLCRTVSEGWGNLGVDREIGK